jgi:transposase
MPKFKYVDNSQNVMIPIDLTKQLLPGTFEHSSCLVIDQLDLSILESKYNNDDKGAYAYPPSLLLKIIINAYRKGIINSRGIEALCLENILFISIAGGLHPDHSTLSHFLLPWKKKSWIFFLKSLLYVMNAV